MFALFFFCPKTVVGVSSEPGREFLQNLFLCSVFTIGLNVVTLIWIASGFSGFLLSIIFLKSYSNCHNHEFFWRGEDDFRLFDDGHICWCGFCGLAKLYSYKVCSYFAFEEPLVALWSFSCSLCLPCVCRGFLLTSLQLLFSVREPFILPKI